MKLKNMYYKIKYENYITVEKLYLKYILKTNMFNLVWKIEFNNIKCRVW